MGPGALGENTGPPVNMAQHGIRVRADQQLPRKMVTREIKTLELIVYEAVELKGVIGLEGPQSLQAGPSSEVAVSPARRSGHLNPRVRPVWVPALGLLPI